MATKTNPKDLRRLMKEQQNKSRKKINSPLARYNNAGQLFCVLCNTILKSDLLWDAHVRGSKHKENLVALKSGQGKSQAATTKNSSVQPNIEDGRRIQQAPHSCNKRRKDEQNSQAFSQEVPAPKKLKASSPPGKLSIPSDFFDKDLVSGAVDEQQMATDNDMDTTPAVPCSALSNESALPSDFFDRSSATSEAPKDAVESSKEKELDKSESIPEGFFDDPKLDAKARKVEYKDPAEEEWEKFQKALSTESQVSEAIIHEEEEESRIDRALDEISEQRLYYIRADVLRDKQTAFKNSRNEKQDQAMGSGLKEDSESDSDDMEELFNWRAKKA